MADILVVRDYLCVMGYERHCVQDVFIEGFALIRTHISGIWKH